MLDKIKAVAKNIKFELKVWKLIFKDARTPWIAKLLLALAIGYVLIPFDLIPDIIPGIGHLDDVIIVVLVVYIAMKLIPKEVVEDCRARVRYEV
ncbi:MAG: DUF1232 domain-containing protein [Elusimicrobia bacterium]|nr:DUF1232 domain-containing protein [Elusimicrobiota bacterium]